MNLLMEELNTRYADAAPKISREFIDGICYYLDLFNHPDIQVVLEEQKSLPKGHYHGFLKSHAYLVRKIYEPVRTNSDLLWWRFYGFDLLYENVSIFQLMYMFPTWKALAWDRPIYLYSFKKVHERLTLALRNKSLLEVQMVTTQPSKFTKLRSALNITPQTKWSDITLRFSNEYDVEILHGSKSYKSNHEELGFQDKRGEAKPKLSWNFLKVLSVNEGSYPMQQYIGNERVNKSKEKQALAAQLTTIFGIEDEPFELFFPTSTSYKIKLNLTPEQAFRPDFRDRDIFSDDEPPNFPQPSLAQ